EPRWRAEWGRRPQPESVALRVLVERARPTGPVRARPGPRALRVEAVSPRERARERARDALQVQRARGPRARAWALCPWRAPARPRTPRPRPRCRARGRPRST